MFEYINVYNFMCVYRQNDAKPLSVTRRNIYYNIYTAATNVVGVADMLLTIYFFPKAYRENEFIYAYITSKK